MKFCRDEDLYASNKTPLTATAPMPDCTMKIYVGNSEQEVVAENVKIGDALTLVINIDFQGELTYQSVTDYHVDVCE